MRCVRPFSLGAGSIQAESLPATTELLSTRHTKYDGQPGLFITYVLAMQRAGFDLKAHVAEHRFIYKRRCVLASFSYGHRLVNELCGFRSTSQIDALADPWSRDEIGAFLTRLSRSAYSSVDAFLERNVEDIDLGKYLIAHTLKQKENPDRLFPPNSSGWYQYLFTRLLVEDRPEFEKNNLAIVTFNYDRSLEAYLDLVLQNRFRMSSESAHEILAQLPILHVHGILGSYPEVPYQPNTDSPSEVRRISQEIQIISEIADRDDGFCNAQFEQANQYLVEAGRIFFLGFGFNSNNIRRFRFFNKSNLEGKEIRATDQGFDGEVLREAFERFGEFGIDAGIFTHSAATCELFFHRVARLE